MKSASQLRESWNLNDEERSAWAKVIATPTWKMATELVAAEFTQSSRSVMRHDVDQILARKLMRLDGALAAIEALQQCAEQQKPMEPPLTEYDDAYILKLQKEKLSQHQQ